jgi:CHAT domain-containing protein
VPRPRFCSSDPRHGTLTSREGAANLVASIVLLAIALMLASGAEAHQVQCDSRIAKDFSLPLELGLAVPAGVKAVLVVEEVGSPIELALGSGPKQDLPPDGRAFEIVTFEAESDTRVQVTSSRGLEMASLVIRLECFPLGNSVPGYDSAAAMARASQLLASAEYATDPLTAEGARLEAVELLENASTAPAFGSWPWLPAAAEHSLGFLHARLNNPYLAQVHYVNAAKRWMEQGDSRRAAWAQLRAAQQLRRLGQSEGAEKSIHQATILAGSVADDILSVSVLSEACLLWRLRAEALASRDCYRNALGPSLRLGHVAESATLLANLADVELQLGEIAAAANHAERAMDMVRSADSPRSLLLATTVSAGVLRARGYVEESLNLYAEAESIATALQDQSLRANILFQQALTWSLLTEDRSRQLAARASAAIYEELGNTGRALRARWMAGDADPSSSAKFARAFEDDQALAIEAARHCLDQKDFACASRLLNALPPSASLPYVRAQAADLLRGNSALLQGSSEDAVRLSEVVLRRALDRGSVLHQLDALMLRGASLSAIGNRTAAADAYREALVLSKALAELQSYPLHRKRLTEAARQAFDQLLRLDRSSGSREVDALLSLKPSTRPALLTTQGGDNAKRNLLAKINLAMQRHWNVESTESVDAPVLSRAQLTAWSTQLAKRSDPSFAVPVQRDPNRHHVDVFVGSDAVYFWSQRDGIVRHHWALIDEAKLEQDLQQLNSLLSTPRSSPAGVLRQASDLGSRLGLDRLAIASDSPVYITLDGALGAAPIGLMLDAASGKLEPSVRAIVAVDAGFEPAEGCCTGRRLVTLADPQGGVGSTGTSLSRLPGARAESRALAKAWTTGEYVAYLGQDATVANFKQALGDTQNLVHLATHGLLDDEALEISGFLLAGEDAKLRVLGAGELLSIKAATPLVVLSACDAGASVRNKASTSLAQTLIYNGVSRVIAPSWKVDDEAAVHFMTAFWTQLDAGDAVDVALVEARRELQKTARFSHPFYWAGMQQMEATPTAVEQK